MDKCKSVSYGLEMAYYDWCISKMAEMLGENQLAESYSKKGRAYAMYFDNETLFMRGKMSDGSWDQDFDPNFSDHLESAFVEGNSWQWTPFVPHDPKGLAKLMGGKEAFGKWLDKLFSTKSKVSGENASGDITGLIGQYAHGNEQESPYSLPISIHRSTMANTRGARFYSNFFLYPNTRWNYRK